MILPTSAEVTVLKAAAAKRFGSERLLLVKLTAPIEAALVLAPLDLKSYGAHVDARQERPATAAASVIVDRLLWCSGTDTPGFNRPEPGTTVDTLVPSKEDADPLRTVALARLETLREAWPACDEKAESELRAAAGDGHGVATAEKLTEGNAPKGFAIPGDAPTSGPGSLWIATHPGPAGVRYVMRTPLPDVWTAAKAHWLAAIAAKSGQCAAAMQFAREHVVWSPEPMDQILDRLPAIGPSMIIPFLQMGGFAAEAVSSFL